MEKLVSAKDRAILRELAKKQLEIATSPEMQRKEKLWYDHNDCKTRDPVITLERWTFNREFEHLWKPTCESEQGRNLEYWFHSNMVQYEYIHDDTVMPREFPVGIHAWLKPFDIDIKRERSIAQTHAYKIDHEVKDLEADFAKLKRSPMDCNKDGALEYKEFVDDIMGDLIPSRLTFTPGSSFAQNVYMIMGLETMMTSMYDYPELFHKMMTMLADDYCKLWELAEERDCVMPNNFNTGIPQGSYGFTTLLPKNKSGKYNLGDVWGYMDSQETSEISPAMYNEFFFPYYKRISERFGFFSYGCCEGVSPIWEDSVSKYENLRKVSISKWCNEEFIGDKLRGRDIIFHRKPFPNYLAIDKEFDEKGFGEHIERTLKAAKGCFLEFSYRDVYSLQGDIYRGRKVMRVIREMIDKYWE